MGSCWATLGSCWCILDQDGVMNDHDGIFMTHLGTSLGFMGLMEGSWGRHGDLHGAKMAPRWTEENAKGDHKIPKGAQRRSTKFKRSQDGRPRGEHVDKGHF